MICEKLHRVATSISMMARIETKLHELGIGLIEQRFNLIFVLNMGIRVRVENDREAVLPGYLADPLGCVD